MNVVKPRIDINVETLQLLRVTHHNTSLTGSSTDISLY